MQSSLQKFQKTDDLAPVVELCVAQQKKTFPLLVKTLTGKKIEIMTDLGDTIRTVKSIIQQQEAIKLNLQKLLYAGRKLEDNKTLSDYKIKQGEWIYLVIRNKEDDDDSDEDKDDSEGEEERETKQAPSDKEKIGPIEVEYKNELLFTIDVSKGETIGDIKQKILAKAEIDNLRLLHDGKRVVDDQKTVEDYKFFGPSNKLQVQGDIKSKYASEFSLNIVCQQMTQQQQVSSTTQVKDLRRIVSGLVKYSFTLVFDGKVLLDENATLSSYGISKTVDVIAVPDSNGGNSLRFIQTIETFPAIQNADELKNSLSFLPDQQGLNEIFSQELDSVKGMTQYKSHKPEEVLAARLWTSNILYKQLNECLANNKDLKPWGIYLKCLIKGLKHMNFYRGKVYKGVKGSQNLETYQQGSKVSWKTFVGLTRSKDKAKNAAGDNGVIFEVDAVSTRDLSKITLCSHEEFVLLPYSSFEVTEVVNTPNQPTLIKLRELAMLKGTKQLLWVDDNPEYNYYHAQPLEEKDTSVVFCTSTKDARDLFESHGWLLALDDSKFRVVSDMVRDENGKPNYIAGIQLLKAIFEDYKSNARSMIFCNNLQKANESAANENLKGNYKIANQDDELDQFISFS